MDPDIRFDDLLASAAGRDEAWYHLRQGDRLFIELARLVDAGRVPVDAATRVPSICSEIRSLSSVRAC